MVKPFITLKDVSIDAHGRKLFERFNWNIAEGENWAVVGPNASGKTTLLKVIAGTHGFQGTMEYGFDKAKIAYVSFESQRSNLGDEPFLQDRWNVGLAENAPTAGELLSEEYVDKDNPYVIGEHHKDAGFARRREEVIAQLGIEPLLSRTIMQLSNGERRKIFIARALLKNPKLLLLDNPFEGLDEMFRAKFRETLNGLMERGLHMIIATRDEKELPSGITNVLHIGEQTKARDAPEKSLAGVHAAQKTSNTTALVEMNNVNVAYGDVQILKDISWTVREGERWALFGPNGAGKTTLLSLILGDNPQAYANDITLFGYKRGSGESIWDIKKNIGWVAPELQLYYPLGTTAFEVACSGWFDTIGLYREATTDQKEVAEGWLQRFGLSEKAATPFADLSESEQRLALLARALVKNPTLLVLDEPCQGLDEKHRTRVLEAIDWVAKQHNTAMIYVTHRVEELPSSITHVLRLQGRGEPAVIDTPK